PPRATLFPYTTLFRSDTIDLGFPIGLESEIGDFIQSREVRFGAEDIIVLHTDGVTEAEGPTGELFGFDRLAESAARHRGRNAGEDRKSTRLNSSHVKI